MITRTPSGASSRVTSYQSQPPSSIESADTSVETAVRIVFASSLSSAASGTIGMRADAIITVTIRRVFAVFPFILLILSVLLWIVFVIFEVEVLELFRVVLGIVLVSEAGPLRHLQ